MLDDPFALPNPFSREELQALAEQRKQLLRDLDSKDSEVRERAIRKGRSLPAHQITKMVYEATYEGEWTLSKWQRNFVGFVMLLGFAVFFLWAALISPERGILAFFAGLLCCGLVSTAIEIKYHKAPYSQRARDSMTIVVENVQDPAFLPDAMRLLYTKYSVSEVGQPGIPRGLYRAAERFLVTLKIEEIRAFAIQQQAFYLFLSYRWGENRHLTVRVLQILTEIGTSSATPYVAGIANNLMTSAELRPAREAARACLQVLKQREKEAAIPATLLRASSAPAPPADTLLRPAINVNGVTAPEFLLRATADIAGEPAKQGKMVSEDHAALQTTL